MAIPRQIKVKLLILEAAIHLIIHNFSLSLSFPVNKYTTKAPTTKKMTACEQLRSSTKDFTSGTYYIPVCTITGEYEKRQCEGKAGSKKCWCVNPKGVEIPGTQMIEPDMPDCHKGITDFGYPRWDLWFSSSQRLKLFSIVFSPSQKFFFHCHWKQKFNFFLTWTNPEFFFQIFQKFLIGDCRVSLPPLLKVNWSPPSYDDLNLTDN